jgi:hypothetical protein
MEMDINMNLNKKKLVGLSFKCEDCDIEIVHRSFNPCSKEFHGHNLKAHHTT